MPTICEACGRHNRTQAMFCSGCLNKLPAFVATGPSALETLTNKSSAGSISANPAHILKRSIAKTNFPLKLALLLIALCTVFVGWVSMMPRNGEATLQLVAAGGAANPMAAAPAIIPHSSPSLEPGADSVSLKPADDASTTKATDEQAPSHADPSALDTVVVFYRALSVGDGRRAAAVVTPAKRGVTAFREDRIASFYGSLREPLVIESIRPIAVNHFEARYSYRATHALCSARATVETEVINQQTYIRSIRAPC